MYVCVCVCVCVACVYMWTFTSTHNRKPDPQPVESFDNVYVCMYMYTYTWGYTRACVQKTRVHVYVWKPIHAQTDIYMYTVLIQNVCEEDSETFCRSLGLTPYADTGIHDNCMYVQKRTCAHIAHVGMHHDAYASMIWWTCVHTSAYTTRLCIIRP